MNKMEDEELQDEEEAGAIDANVAPEEVGVQLAKAGNSALKERKEVSLEGELRPFTDGQEESLDEGEGQLTIDMYQTPDEIVLESPIAGVKAEDLDIAITSESVTIRGSRQKDRRVKDEEYFYQECYWGRFSRSIILPQEVDAEKAEASVKNGVLTIKLPKLNRQRSKKLKVQSE